MKTYNTDEVIVLYNLYKSYLMGCALNNIKDIKLFSNWLTDRENENI